MANTLVVHKGRTNNVDVNLNRDITGMTFTSEIRTEPNRDSSLIATWTVSVTTLTPGEISLTLTHVVSGQILQDVGYMDIKGVDSGGYVEAIFDQPIKVEFRGTVTE